MLRLLDLPHLLHEFHVTMIKQFICMEAGRAMLFQMVNELIVPKDAQHPTLFMHFT